MNNGHEPYMLNLKAVDSPPNGSGVKLKLKHTLPDSRTRLDQRVRQNTTPAAESERGSGRNTPQMIQPLLSSDAISLLSRWALLEGDGSGIQHVHNYPIKYKDIENDIDSPDYWPNPTQPPPRGRGKLALIQSKFWTPLDGSIGFEGDLGDLGESILEAQDYFLTSNELRFLGMVDARMKAFDESDKILNYERGFMRHPLGWWDTSRRRLCHALHEVDFPITAPIENHSEAFAKRSAPTHYTRFGPTPNTSALENVSGTDEQFFGFGALREEVYIRSLCTFGQNCLDKDNVPCRYFQDHVRREIRNLTRGYGPIAMTVQLAVIQGKINHALRKAHHIKEEGATSGHVYPSQLLESRPFLILDHQRALTEDGEVDIVHELIKLEKGAATMASQREFAEYVNKPIKAEVLASFDLGSSLDPAITGGEQSVEGLLAENSRIIEALAGEDNDREMQLMLNGFSSSRKREVMSTESNKDELMAIMKRNLHLLGAMVPNTEIVGKADAIKTESQQHTITPLANNSLSNLRFSPQSNEYTPSPGSVMARSAIGDEANLNQRYRKQSTSLATPSSKVGMETIGMGGGIFQSIGRTNMTTASPSNTHSRAVSGTASNAPGTYSSNLLPQARYSSNGGSSRMNASPPHAYKRNDPPALEQVPRANNKQQSSSLQTWKSSTSTEPSLKEQRKSTSQDELNSLSRLPEPQTQNPSYHLNGMTLDFGQKASDLADVTDFLNDYPQESMSTARPIPAIANGPNFTKQGHAYGDTPPLPSEPMDVPELDFGDLLTGFLESDDLEID